MKLFGKRKVKMREVHVNPSQATQVERNAARIGRLEWKLNELKMKGQDGTERYELLMSELVKRRKMKEIAEEV